MDMKYQVDTLLAKLGSRPNDGPLDFNVHSTTATGRESTISIDNTGQATSIESIRDSLPGSIRDSLLFTNGSGGGYNTYRESYSSATTGGRMSSPVVHQVPPPRAPYESQTMNVESRSQWTSDIPSNGTQTQTTTNRFDVCRNGMPVQEGSPDIRNAYGFLNYVPMQYNAKVCTGTVEWNDNQILSETHYHHGDHHHGHHQRHVHHFHDLHLLGSAEEILDLRNAPLPTSHVIPGEHGAQMKMRPCDVGRQAFEAHAEAYFATDFRAEANVERKSFVDTYQTAGPAPAKVDAGYRSYSDSFSKPPTVSTQFTKSTDKPWQRKTPTIDIEAERRRLELLEMERKAAQVDLGVLCKNGVTIFKDGSAKCPDGSVRQAPPKENTMVHAGSTTVTMASIMKVGVGSGNGPMHVIGGDVYLLPDLSIRGKSGIITRLDGTRVRSSLGFTVVWRGDRCEVDVISQGVRINVEAGFVLQKINGSVVTHDQALRNMVEMLIPGEFAILTFAHPTSGAVFDEEVTITTATSIDWESKTVRPGSPQEAKKIKVRPYIGLSLRWIDDDEGHIDNLAQVHELVPGGPADKAGLQVDDVITQWEDIKVDGEASFGRIMKVVRIGQEASILINRNGETIAMKITVEGTERDKQPRRKVRTTSQKRIERERSSSSRSRTESHARVSSETAVTQSEAMNTQSASSLAMQSSMASITASTSEN